MLKILSYKRTIAIICCSIGLNLTFFNTSYSQLINVACVGNSITAGAGVADSATQSYPAQLRVLLGSGYLTSNFGYSGATLAKNGDTPYWLTDRYTAAIGSNPNIVMILLGTNDSKSWNWAASAGEFVADYESMINVFRSLPSNPRIFIGINSKAFSTAYAIDESVLASYIRPDEVQIAKIMGVSIIDIYDTTKNDSLLFADGIHPGIAGSGVLAAKVKELITDPIPQITQIGSVLSAPAANSYQWYLNGDTIAAANGGTNKSLTITTAGTYSVGLKLNNTNQDRLMSANFVVTGALAIPAAPTRLTSTAGNAVVSLNWAASAGADTYTVERATTTGGPYAVIQSGISTTSYTNTGLTNGITYYYVVTASNSKGASGNSLESNATPLSSYAAEPNHAYYFVGTDSIQAIVANPHIDGVPGPFDSVGTVEGWIRPNWVPGSQASDMAFFSMMDWWGTRWGIYIGKDYGSIGIAGTTTSYLLYTFQPGLWYHIAAVFNTSGTVTVYVNGISIGTSASVINTSITGTPFKIGISWSWATNEHFIGGMDEVRVWKTQRTASEIAANFLTIVPPSNTDLMAYYKFDELSGSVLPDLTNNSYNGAMQYWGNNVAVSTTSPTWVESYALAIPTAVMPTSLTNISFIANWTSPLFGTVNNYLLDVSTDRNFGSFVTGYNRLNVGNVTSYTVTGLPSATKYYYRLSANKVSVANQGGLSNIDSTSFALPVQLLSFTAQQQGNNVLLQWQTAQELNNDYFNIQYSSTGNDWSVIGKVQAKSGNTNVYTFIHNPTVPTNYYRLQQVDDNGNYSFSEIRVVNLTDSGEEKHVQIYPNPTNGNSITISLITSISKSLPYTIINNSGVAVQEGTIIHNQQSINIAGLAIGSYIFKIANEEPVQFVKE